MTNAFDRSASKTSRLLTEMAEDGRVEGPGPDGEDVVSLPDDAE